MPAKKTVKPKDDDEFVDETLSERLWGLTEMFPECVRKFAGWSAKLTQKACCKFYRFTRYSLWAASTSFIILCLPIIFEQERYNLEQQHMAHQRQMLLGPSAAMNGMASNIPVAVQ